jgi:hypothetical protein
MARRPWTNEDERKAREIERRSRERQIKALGLEMVEFIERVEALTDEDIARIAGQEADE